MTRASPGLQAFLRAKATLERLFHDPAIPEAIRDALRDALIDLTPSELRMADAGSCESSERGSAPHDALHVWLARVYNHPDEVLAALDARYVRREPPAQAETTEPAARVRELEAALAKVAVLVDSAAEAMGPKNRERFVQVGPLAMVPVFRAVTDAKAILDATLATPGASAEKTEGANEGADR